MKACRPNSRTRRRTGGRIFRNTLTTVSIIRSDSRKYDYPNTGSGEALLMVLEEKYNYPPFTSSSTRTLALFGTLDSAGTPKQQEYLLSEAFFVSVDPVTSRIRQRHFRCLDITG